MEKTVNNENKLFAEPQTVFERYADMVYRLAFVRTKNSLLPLEVKARRGTSKSLATLIAREKYPDIRYGLKASAGNIGFSDNILTFPYFCVFLLKRFLDVCEL